MKWISVLGMALLSGCTVGTDDLGTTLQQCEGKWESDDSCGDIRGALIGALTSKGSATLLADSVNTAAVADEIADGLREDGTTDNGFYTALVGTVDPADVADHVDPSEVADQIADGLKSDGASENGFYGRLGDEVAANHASELADALSVPAVADEISDGRLSDGVTDNGFFTALAEQIAEDPSALAGQIVSGTTGTTFVTLVAPELATKLVALGDTFFGGLASSLLDSEHSDAFSNVVSLAVDLGDLALQIALLPKEDRVELTSDLADQLAAEHSEELTDDTGLRGAVADDLAVDTGFVEEVAAAVEPALSADGSTLRTGVASDLAENEDFKTEVTDAALASLSGTEIVGMIDTYTLETGAFPWNAEVVAAVDAEVGSVGRSGVESLALAIDDYASSTSVTDVSERVATIETAYPNADAEMRLRLDAIEGADYQSGSDVLTTLASYATTTALDTVSARVLAIESAYPSADTAMRLRLDAIEGAHYQTASDVITTLEGYDFPSEWIAQVDTEVNGLMGDLVDLVDAGSVEFDPAQALLTFSAINVRIANGGDSTATTNGTGNLILGYDEDDGADTKTGSHNLIVGSGHTYTGYGNIVSGYDSTVEANYAGTFGGYSAFVYANYAATLAGAGNELYSVMSAAVGGAGNEVIQDDATATGYAGVAVGGQATHVSGEYSVVSGGYSNYATGAYSSVSGGEHNRAEWSGTWVGGGHYNRAGYHDDGSGDVAAVVGGYNNWAGHEGSVVLGGEGNAYALIDSTADYSVTP